MTTRAATTAAGERAPARAGVATVQAAAGSGCRSAHGSSGVVACATIRRVPASSAAAITSRGCRHPPGYGGRARPSPLTTAPDDSAAGAGIRVAPLLEALGGRILRRRGVVLRRVRGQLLGRRGRSLLRQRLGGGVDRPRGRRGGLLGHGRR